MPHYRMTYRVKGQTFHAHVRARNKEQAKAKIAREAATHDTQSSHARKESARADSRLESAAKRAKGRKAKKRKRERDISRVL